MATIEFLRMLPKIQLHCHVEGTLRAATFVDLARRHGIALSYHPQAGAGAFSDSHVPTCADDLYRFDSFGAFLLTFAAVSRSLAEPRDYARLAAEYVEDATAQNVAYAELFISPSVWRFFHTDLDARACIRAMRHEFDKSGIHIALIMDLTRNFGVASAIETAKLAVELRDEGVIGIGLGGDEARFPAELFSEPFAYARARGMHCVAHAGEAAGPQSIRAAVETLGAERIGHGVRALEDSSVVEMLARRSIPLEICPTSNFLTGAASREVPHPFIALDAAGCVVTIDSDDPALFGTSITDEYAYVVQSAGIAALMRFMRNAIDASFAEPSHKALLHARLDGADLEPGHRRRT